MPLDQTNVCIVQDRYGGVYIDGARGGAKWLAIDGSTLDVAVLIANQEGPFDDDPEARAFWDQNPRPNWIAWGATPNDALAMLELKANY